MVLTFSNYLGLMTGLDEYTECKYEKRELQNLIFKHLTDKYGTFIAENCNGDKALFNSYFQRSAKTKASRKHFICFMNTPPRIKRKKKYENSI